MKNIFLTIHLFIFSQGFAQSPSLVARYDSATIYLDGIRSFVKNGSTRPVGLFLNKIQAEFQPAPQGKLVFQKARKNRITSVGLLSFGYAAMIGGVISANTAHASGNSNDSGRILTGTAVMLAGASIAICATIPYRRSQKQLNQAIWLRNKEVLFK